MGKCGKGSRTRIGTTEGGSRRFSTCIAHAFGLLQFSQAPLLLSDEAQYCFGAGSTSGGTRRKPPSVPLANTEWRQTYPLENGPFRAHIPRMATIVRCNCGAEYKRTETKFLVPHTGDAVCAVCGAALESWWKSTHVPSFELIKRPDRKTA